MTARCSRVRLGLGAIAALTVCLLSGCGGEEFDRVVWMERGRQELVPFKQRLMGALMEGLAEGPESAIEVCQVVAPGIAGEMSGDGVEVGRTSHKLRNARNAPRPWTQPLLAEYVSTRGKREPEVVRLPGGAVGYVEPIFVNQMCLACHGSALAPGIASRIDEHYPDDRARGFEDGDFRGLFWVEFKAAGG